MEPMFVRNLVNFSCLQDQPGINTESSYPYTASNSSCKYKLANVGATIKGYINLPSDEVKIRNAVAKIGPVGVVLHTSDTFFSYKSGIFNQANCPTQPTHAVLIVGYGTEKGVDFWIVKNSWGTGWGESGFFRIARGNKMCGFGTDALYPVV
jgi:C1A family cysteine protease